MKEGDRLLLLDSPAFGEAQLDYRKARNALAVTGKSLERAEALLDRGAIGAGEHQRREADYENARADLHEAEEKLHLLGMTEREIRRLAAKTLPHAEVAQVFLRAPFRGEVIERNATIGEVVDPNKMLFTVADLSTVWRARDFPEQQAGQIEDRPHRRTAGVGLSGPDVSRGHYLCRRRDRSDLKNSHGTRQRFPTLMVDCARKCSPRSPC